MRTEAEILLKIEELQHNLAGILERAKEEMRKPYLARDQRLLRFLNREKNVWEYALLQLKWLLRDPLL
jgi:hypothetical protein